MVSYGTVDGLDGVGGSDHPVPSADPPRNIVAYDIEDRIVARVPWVRVGAAISLGLAAYYLLGSSSVGGVVPSSSGPAGSSGAGATTFEDPHNENRELFYRDQLVDHFGGDGSTWTHRYYASKEHFAGPGHPIFMVVGGEGALDRMLYPFVTGRLAAHFGAAVIQIEHRFYGPHRPVSGREATVPELLALLTPRQAMADMVRLGRVFKGELGCPSRRDRSSPDYCPVVAVGGSYPGVLSALFRLAHPDFVDISYASSAPLRTHTQTIDQYVYYDIVSMDHHFAHAALALPLPIAVISLSLFPSLSLYLSAVSLRT
jgi:hypothetical protein